MTRPLTNSSQIVEELDALVQKLEQLETLPRKVDQLLDISNQCKSGYTKEELEAYAKIGMTPPSKKGKEEVNWAKWTFLLLFIWILCMFVAALPMKGCNISPNPGPNPSPVSSNIYVGSQDEYDVVIGALDFVGNEWALSHYDSVAEAKQGLGAMMGGSTGGVNSVAYNQILSSFTEGCDFLGVVETVKKK